jgi:hypothetical protein
LGDFSHSRKYDQKSTIVFENMGYAVVDAGLKTTNMDESVKRLEVQQRSTWGTWANITILISEENDRTTVFIEAKRFGGRFGGGDMKAPVKNLFAALESRLSKLDQKE